MGVRCGGQDKIMDTAVDDGKQQMRKIEEQRIKVEERIRKVEELLTKMQEQIEGVERQLMKDGGEANAGFLGKKELELRGKENHLRQTEQVLRKNEQVLLRHEEKLLERKLLLMTKIEELKQQMTEVEQQRTKVEQQRTKVEQQMMEVKQQIREVEEEIMKVGQEMSDVEGQLMTAARETDVTYLQKKEVRLRDEEDRLWKVWDQLQAEKVVLLKAADTSEVTPLKPQFQECLLDNQGPIHGTELKGMLEYLWEVPCSLETKNFIKNHLYQVPDITNVHFDVVVPLDGSCFWRDDIFKLLVSNKSSGLILSGRWRLGKTMAMAHEVIRARREIYGLQDRVLFYYPGEAVLGAHVLTIIKILAHMNIPCLWDEFTDVGVNLAKYYQMLFESRLAVPRLCAVLFGSEEADINDRSKRFFSGLALRGAGVLEMPLPSMELLFAMLQYRKPNLNSFEIGARFLRKFLVCGFNLSSHMEEDADVESLESMREGGISGVCLLTGTRLEALERLATNRNMTDGIAAIDLLNLEKNQYIQKRATGRHYDFRDPQLIAVANANSSLECVEGFVFELLLRDFLKPQLFQFLIEKFPALEGLQAKETHVFHGNLTKNCEMNGLIFYGDNGIVLSCKRSQGLQDWSKSFLSQLNHLSVEGKKESPQLHKDLALCRRLFFVCVGVLDGELRGPAPSIYNHADLSLGEKYISEEKKITAVTIFLHDLLALLPAVKMTRSSCSRR